MVLHHDQLTSEKWHFFRQADVFRVYGSTDAAPVGGKRRQRWKNLLWGHRYTLPDTWDTELSVAIRISTSYLLRSWDVSVLASAAHILKKEVETFLLSFRDELPTYAFYPFPFNFLWDLIYLFSILTFWAVPPSLISSFQPISVLFLICFSFLKQLSCPSSGCSSIFPFSSVNASEV